MSRKKAQVGLRARTVDHLNAWLIMLPSLVLMLFFVWKPLFESVVMSLYKTRNIELVNFIGFKNYISVMGKDDFLQALTNTFSYTFWSLLLGFFLPMVLALLIGETEQERLPHGGVSAEHAAGPRGRHPLVGVLLRREVWRAEHPAQPSGHCAADVPDALGVGHPHHHPDCDVEGRGRDGADLHGGHVQRQPGTVRSGSD